MSLDFHRLDNNEYLFGLDEKQIHALADIFDSFKQRTGLIIDPYGKFQLTVENQQTLTAIIEKYIDATDLNKDKGKTSAILAFKGLLQFFQHHKIDLKLIGD